MSDLSRELELAEEELALLRRPQKLTIYGTNGKPLYIAHIMAGQDFLWKLPPSSGSFQGRAVKLERVDG